VTKLDKRPWLVFAALSVALIAASVILLPPGADRSGWRPASCMPDACFCEGLRPGGVAQPVNTYSNLAFVLVGCLVLFAPQARARDARAFRATYGSSVIVIGIGSLFYHATLSFAGQWLDVMGMYLLATLLVLSAAARVRPLPGPAFAAAYLAVNAALGILLVAAPELRRFLFAGLILAAVGLELAAWRLRRPPASGRYFAAALACLALGYGIWILDNARIVCAPDSFLQGHAAWHLLSAAAAGLMFAHNRSEG
jgi:dihydroceramidase